MAKFANNASGVPWWPKFWFTFYKLLVWQCIWKWPYLGSLGEKTNVLRREKSVLRVILQSDKVRQVVRIFSLRLRSGITQRLHGLLLSDLRMQGIIGFVTRLLVLTLRCTRIDRQPVFEVFKSGQKKWQKLENVGKNWRKLEKNVRSCQILPKLA